MKSIFHHQDGLILLYSLSLSPSLPFYSSLNPKINPPPNKYYLLYYPLF